VLHCPHLPSDARPTLLSVAHRPLECGTPAGKGCGCAAATHLRALLPCTCCCCCCCSCCRPCRDPAAAACLAAFPRPLGGCARACCCCWCCWWWWWCCCCCACCCSIACKEEEKVQGLTTGVLSAKGQAMNKNAALCRPLLTHPSQPLHFQRNFSLN